MAWTEFLGVAGAAISGLLGLVVTLIAVIYRNDREAYKADKKTLEDRVLADREAYKTDKKTLEDRVLAVEHLAQAQATMIATLQANAVHAERHDERLGEALDKLDATQNAILQELAQQRAVLQELTRRLTPMGMPAIPRPQRGG